MTKQLMNALIFKEKKIVAKGPQLLILPAK
jgi:hypothetical protein